MVAEHAIVEAIDAVATTRSLTRPPLTRSLIS